MPLTTAFRCQDYVDNHSPVYSGTLGLGIDPRLATARAGADLLLVIGARLDEPTSGSYATIQAPRPHQTPIHVHADPDELGRVFEPRWDVRRQRRVPRRRRALPAPDRARSAAGRPPRPPTRARSGRRSRPVDGVDLARRGLGAVRRARARAIVTNGAGNYTLWVHRFWRFQRFGAQLAPVSGSMGTDSRPRSPRSWPSPNARSSRSTATAAS